MRWKLGNYTVKYNPKTNTRSWDAQQDITINMNGEISNPNLLFKGTQDFTIDIYERPTYYASSLLTGSYIGASEKITNERMFMLKSNSTFDVKAKTNSVYGTYTIVTGNSITLPTGNPSSIVSFDSSLAFIYPSSNQSSLLITDENGVANRKYIYSSDDLKYGEEIAWDYDLNLLALNPYGKIYRINKSTGVSSFLYQFDDYSSNFSKSLKKYTSIFVTEKNGKYYIGVLQGKTEIIYIDYISLEIVCKAETKLGNVLAISHSHYSDDYFLIFSSKILKLYPNTSRIDVDYIKSVVSNGQITIYDELNIPMILSIRDMTVSRERNMHESRYELSISAEISYSNIGFGNTWS